MIADCVSNKFQDRVCEVILPRLQRRAVLEEQGLLKPRWSALEQDLEEMDKEEEAQRMVSTNYHN